MKRVEQTKGNVNHQSTLCKQTSTEIEIEINELYDNNSLKSISSQMRV